MRFHTVGLGIAATVACAAALTLVGPAAVAAAPDAGAAATERHCAFVLDKLRPGEATSRVVRQGCAGSQRELAGVVGPAARTHLLSMYVDANYGGTSKHWYGEAGPCDTEGYGIRNIGTTFFDINDKISSWIGGHSRCNYVNMWEHAAYAGQHAYWHNYTRVPYVGDRMNDKVTSVHVHYEP